MNNHKIILTDVTMRDGMHAMAHQFSTDDMAIIAQALDEAGMDIIEVTHGDGLGGHSLQYGLAKHTDAEYLEAVSSKIKNAKLSVLLIPGIGTIHDLNSCYEIRNQNSTCLHPLHRSRCFGPAYCFCAGKRFGHCWFSDDVPYDITGRTGETG